MQRTDEDWHSLRSEITDTFSPGAPVQERDLFAGRQEQLLTLIDTVQQRGRHAVVFGERGVGKTSITNVLGLALRGPRRDVISVKVNADPQDSFESIWRKVFKRLNYESQKEGGQVVVRTIADDYAGRLTPDDVQLELSNFSAHQIPLIILDEFDRISDESVTQLMADTIKALSDYSVNATIIVVGVAEDVTGLIKGHESIARSLIQVRMPRMSPDELGEIILSRYKKCGIKVDLGGTLENDIPGPWNSILRALAWYARRPRRDSEAHDGRRRGMRRRRTGGCRVGTRRIHKRQIFRRSKKPTE